MPTGGSRTSSGALIKTSVVLTPEQLDALAEMSSEAHVSKSTLFRQMLAERIRDWRAGKKSRTAVPA